MTHAADVIRDRRRAFAAPGGFHDRLVRTLAVGLPAAVGMIAAVMILAPLSPRGEISFLLDRNKVQLVRDRLSAEQARYRGVDNAGRPFSMTAGSAVQQSARDPVVELRDLMARIMLRDGPAEIEAPAGRYAYDANLVDIRGPVRFWAADGYRVAMQGVQLDLKAQRMVGSGGISGAIPAGTFSADSITADLGTRTFTLAGNARLRMIPGQLRMPE
jgi:lipopolysaccharide export system protein LptC